MAELVTDPNDPRLGHGHDELPGAPQNAAYLVLSEEERAKGFVRPVRMAYVHRGIHGPRYQTRDLDEKEASLYRGEYVKYEPYPQDGSHGSSIGRFWTQKELDSIGKGCGMVTTMSRPLAETYAREPGFYGSTYCCVCTMHRPVNEFVWDGTDEEVGSR